LKDKWHSSLIINATLSSTKGKNKPAKPEIKTYINRTGYCSYFQCPLECLPPGPVITTYGTGAGFPAGVIMPDYPFRRYIIFAHQLFGKFDRISYGLIVVTININANLYPDGVLVGNTILPLKDHKASAWRHILSD